MYIVCPVGISKGDLVHAESIVYVAKGAKKPDQPAILRIFLKRDEVSATWRFNSDEEMEEAYEALADVLLLSSRVESVAQIRVATELGLLSPEESLRRLSACLSEDQRIKMAKKLRG